jgi:hypothetical protein
MDNYYSLIRTFQYLHNIKHNVIGTTQLRRITSELAMKKSTLRGTMKWRITTKMNDENEEHASILSYAWKDSGVIYFMLTCHQGGNTIMVERQSVELQ